MLPDDALPVPEGVVDEAELSRAARVAGVGEPAGAEEFMMLDVGISAAEEVPAPELDDDVELSSTASRAAGVGVPDGVAELKVGVAEVAVSSRAAAATLGVTVGEVGLAVFRASAAMREATPSALTDVVGSDVEGELGVNDPGLEELAGPSTLIWNSLEAGVGDADSVLGFVKLEAVGAASWAATDGVAEPVTVTVVVRVVVEVATPGDSTAANS